MGLGEINLRQKVHKSGGGGGGLLGAIVGAAAGVISGGLLAPLTPLGAAAGAVGGSTVGMGVGSMVGNQLEPGGVETTPHISKLESTVKTDPAAQLAILQNARMKIGEAPDLAQPQADAYLGHIDNAMTELKKRLQLSQGGIG